VHSARKLRATRFLMDGEAVVCGEDGIADFERLHSREHDASALPSGKNAVHSGDERQ
jgi:ATP-dependent DNA ligase